MEESEEDETHPSRPSRSFEWLTGSSRRIDFLYGDMALLLLTYLRYAKFVFVY